MRFHPLRTLSQLESLTVEQLDRFTRQAVRQLSTRKLLLGRCLVALDVKRRARQLGCSSSIHYARLLGIEYREALEVRRVARCLELLPKLRSAAEEGAVSWSSLREIVRKATPETEGRWLDLAGRHTYRAIEKLVRATKFGQMPEDAHRVEELPALEVNLRLVSSHVGAALLEKAARDLGEKLGGAMSLGEALEWLCVHYFSGEITAAARDRCTREILKDIAAEFSQGAEPDPTSSGVPLEGDAESAVQPAAGWRNKRLRFRPDARLTPAQRREIGRRDGYCCSTPGCPNRLWLDVQHVLFFSQGGASLPENLILLCSSCHRNVHDGWLIVFGEAPYDLFWFDPQHDPLMRPRLNDLQPEEMRYRNHSYEELYGLVEEVVDDTSEEEEP